MSEVSPKPPRKPRKAKGTNGVKVDFNPSGIRPVEFNVLVKPKEVEERTAGGIIVPDIARDREQVAAVEGEIVAVSPLAFTYEDWGDHEKPKVGDRVYFAKYAGMLVKGRDGVEYRLLKDKDLGAVIDA